MFQALKAFWKNFVESLKTAYNKTFKAPLESATQNWREIENINLLDIVVGKLANLTAIEATFTIESDSAQTDKLKDLLKSLENEKYNLISNMLAAGDAFVMPATDERGELYHRVLSQNEVRILNSKAGKITEAYCIIDYYIDNNNKIYYLLRHHILDDNGTLIISYQTVSDDGKSAYLEKWEYLDDMSYKFSNANHIGFGRYKSPKNSRGMSTVYGVPLNFGCSEIETRIFNDLKLIETEFENGKSKVFADPLILMPDSEKNAYRIPDNIYPIKSRAGQQPSIDIFNPNLRFSEHYSKLVCDLALYEKQIGTSKGILTDNETSYTATATAVKRANADTLALIEKIRAAVDIGNEDTLKADSVFLNISSDLWHYSSDWYDPFEDPSEQWARLLAGQQAGAVETEDLTKWLFPNLSAEEVEQKITNIKANQQTDTDEAINRILQGQ